MTATSASRRVLRRALAQGLAALLSLGAFTLYNAVPHAGAAALAASRATPNRFDPTTRAASVKGTPPAPAMRRQAPPARRGPTAQVGTKPVTVALDPSGPVHVATGDAALDVDVPAGAVSAGDVSAAGGTMSLQVRQVLPGGGGSAGGSGIFTFGTFLVQVLDANGQLAARGLRQPIGFRLHVGGRVGAVDVGHTVAVVNRPLPSWVDLTPASTVTRTGAGAGADIQLTASTRPPVGPTSKQRVAFDAGSQTLSTSAPSSSSSTTVSFDTVAPVSSFGAPDATEVNLSAGALNLDYPLALPGGPGGLTPPLRLGYDSASVSDQHDVAGAAPWVGEGWHLSLGGISWAERDIAAGCSSTGPCAPFTWSDTWQLVDGFGTRAELIPPNFADSTYYEDSNGTAITPSPLTWHTTPDTHARVVSYVGPDALPGMAANPPCFRVFLPNGIMEEFGCTPDSLQFYPQQFASGPLDFVANWLPDLVTDPLGNQIHVTYQADSQSSIGLAYPRDAVMATVEYDSPGCHNAQTACTGAAWAPQMRVSFQASHSVAHVSGASCAANGSLRCDDPVDLSGSAGLAAPLVENTFVLNDALVQIRASGSAAWSTLRDYQLAYDQSGPTTITDPFSGLAESTAGRLNLTRLTEIGADGSTALPSRSFAYSRQTQLYEDVYWGPAPATNCGPSWNVGTGQGCNLWSQSYEGNSYYLSSASNGLGLQQSFGWQLARDNSRGAPTGQDPNDPFVCDAMQSTAPCDRADAGAWSRIVLTSSSNTVTRLSQAGQGGTQTSTPVTGTTTYGYQLMPIDDYWGDWFDEDVMDFYNGKFMGFATVTVTHPDGSREVHTYSASEGFGVYDPSNAQFSGVCSSTNPCPKSPWWDAANAEHGRDLEVDRYNPDGSLVAMVKTQYQVLCPSSGVTGDFAGNLISELDAANFVVLCDIAPSQVDEYFVDGGSQSTAPHLTTVSTHDAYGRITSVTETSSDGGGPGSPTTIVRKASFAWNDGVSATGTSATGAYLVDFPAFADVEDSSGNRYQCAYTSYDGQANATGQTAGLTLGKVTRSDVYTSCGTSANGFTPAGQISTTSTYDTFGNPLTADDPDAAAGIGGHLGCAVGSTTFSSCATYDSTFGVLPTSAANALNQRTSTGYQAPASGTATGGFGLWPTSVTDPNGQTTTLGYDALGRPTGVTLPGEGAGLTTSATAYTVWCSATGAQSPCVEVDHTQRLNGTTTVTSRAFYDGLGRLVETRSPAPNSQDVVRYSFFDASGRLAFQSVPYFVGAYTGGPGSGAYSVPDSTRAGTTSTYDGLGRLTSTTDALSHTSSAGYSVACGAAGTGDTGCYRQVLTVDADAHQGGALVDAMGRTAYEQRFTGSTATTHAVYATSTYTYDFVGEPTQVLQPDGATRTTVQYDMAGRKTGTTDPDRGSETYTYDPSGNMVQSVDARGAAGTIFAGYDGLDRPLWANTTGGPTGAFQTYSYDSTLGGNVGVGRLTGETFSGGAGSTLSGGYSFTYDARGRETGQTLTVGSATYPVQTTYDDAGNVSTEQYPDGETVTSAYTAQGWLSGVSTRQGTTITSLLGGAAYTGVGGALGAITGATLDGTTYQYGASVDLLGRATNLEVTDAAGTTTLFDQSRTYDAVGNVATASTTLPGGTDNQAFCYDEQNRLTWAGSTGTAPCTGTAVPVGTLTAAQYAQSFTYDTMGRLATGPLGSYTYGNGAHVHAATAVGSGYTASYDAAGDMTCRAATAASTCAGASPTGAQLAYDPLGQLASWQSAPASPTSTVAYLYDCQGQRVARQVTQGGATTTTVYVGDLEEVTSSAGTTTTKTYYYAGGKRIAMAVDGTFSYLTSDGLGSTNVVLGASGSAVASQLFTPYGGLRYASGAMPTGYGFTGQSGDAVTGLYYYGARYYDPVSAQFTSADTVVPGGGFNLLGLSRYAYTRGNPTSRIDPSGHDDFGGGDFSGFDTSGFDTSSFDTSSFDTSSFDTSGFDTSGFDTSGFDTSGVDTSGVDTSGDTGSVDTSSAGFDPNAPSIDRSEDPNFGMPSSDGGGGFDPNAPPIDRSEDPNFGMPGSDSGGGFDPNAPPIDRSEDPNFGMPTSGGGFDPNAPPIDRSEDPNFGMPQGTTPSGAPPVLGEGPWRDVVDRAHALATEWANTFRNGGTLDPATERQRFLDMRAEIMRAGADPNISMLGTNSLRGAILRLSSTGNVVGVLGPPDGLDGALRGLNRVRPQ